MKLTKDQITEKREELCKVLVAMNKQRAKADNIKKDLADFGRPTDERRATEGAGVGRPSRQVRSSERVSSVERAREFGPPTRTARRTEFEPFQAGPFFRPHVADGGTALNDIAATGHQSLTNQHENTTLFEAV